VRLAGAPEKGLLNWYYDPLPTNCVNAWFCPASSEEGKNLSVFYGACSFSCLFCQNWHYKYLTEKLEPLVSARELARKVDEKTRCICFFGGDPSPQILHTIETAKLLKDKIRICLETNGMENPLLLKKIAKLCFESGGTIKFDLKFWSEKLSIALSGTSNKQVYKNFSKLARLHKKREEPFLSASTLLIPYYIDLEEIEKIVKFIAGLDPSIPYSLLAFYGCYKMNDLPNTSKKFAEESLKIAKEYLERVRIGNLHLLS
jgi:pyruvate formate lyase activating enzyme